MTLPNRLGSVGTVQARMTIFGYVDPGVGLLAWQAIVATFVGILFQVKKTRVWLLGLVRKKPKLLDEVDAPKEHAGR